MTTPLELLALYSRGALTLAELRARAQVLSQEDTEQLQRWIDEIRRIAATGRIDAAAADEVLAVLASARSETQIPSAEIRAAATLVRPSIELAEPTQAQARIDTDRTEAARTERKAIDPARSEPTQVAADMTQRASELTERAAERTQRASDLTERAAERTQRAGDLTERPANLVQHGSERTERAADRTQRVSEPTERAAGATHERTERSERSEDATVRPTAARTLREADEPQHHVTAFTPTRNAAERTEIIQERLVKSLEDVGEAHYGELRPGVVVKQRFLLERLIGKGGMGLVFAAVDRRKQEANDPNPRVAFKVLNDDFQRHPQSLMALQREARKAQTLAHPNVVTVFDFDRDGDAIYMTMELLKGHSLESIVREARNNGVPPQVAMPIIRGIAEGLAYAHRKGIVHSDLKPGNVFILEDGTPKILDFGIARAVPTMASNELPDVFDAGSLGAYTAAYATPEMVEGIDPHPSDDLYALGIIAYELLVGLHPYQRQSAPKARELALKPPALKGVKRHEARALERCLSFDRKTRPKDAAEFLKVFRGVTTLQKASLAATAVLAVTAGYLSYEYYRETSPSVPFDELPQATQLEFVKLMNEGDNFWGFYTRENNPDALYNALDRYATAYAKHPRNRQAAAALRKVADAFLALTKDDPVMHRDIAQSMLYHSDYYRRYEPVAKAAE